MTQTSADLWLAAVTQRGREREGKGKREAQGARDWMAFPRTRRAAYLWTHVGAAGSNHTAALHTTCQLSGAQQARVQDQ